MSKITCNYNEIHGVFNRRELRMLAQALGLPEERIEERLNKLGIGEIIQTSKLLNLIEKGIFNFDFYRMYNCQSGQYNSLVFAKTLQLIDAHLFSFDDILNIRLAYNVYEMNALKNNKNNLELILQTIKFCNYHISILKLEQYLRHFNLNNSKILHLCEYFDLLLICNRKQKNLIKKNIDIADPKSIDQQIMDELNMKYLRDERNWFFQEKYFQLKVNENSVWPAKLTHQYQMEDASMRKAQLQRQLSESISSLKQSRAGSACSTPSHMSSSSFRRSQPVSDCSFTSLTPIISRSSNNSSAQSIRTITPEIEKQNQETFNRIEKLQADSAFLAIKYALQREDYMNELFPNGYTKPIIVHKPIERHRPKRNKTSIYWSRRTVTK